MGKMKIKLKEGAPRVMKITYRMNPNLRVNVKEEINKMLKYGLIKPLEGLEWVSLMVISIMKDGWNRICVNYMELNVACVIDPFPTLFIEDILECIVGCEIYSFKDGFSGYHQVSIAQEDKEKLAFTTDGKDLYIFSIYNTINTCELYIFIV